MTVDLHELSTVMAGELAVDAGSITATTTAAQVPEWDSLAHLRLCMALEAHYGVAIPMERVGDLDSVAAIATLLESLT